MKISYIVLGEYVIWQTLLKKDPHKLEGKKNKKMNPLFLGD